MNISPYFVSEQFFPFGMELLPSSNSKRLSLKVGIAIANHHFTLEARSPFIMNTTQSVLLNTLVQHEMGAQQEWDPNTCLYQPYEVEQILMPDMANCLAVQAYLKMLQLPFHVEQRANAEQMSPSGKVPFIRCGQFLVSELDPIIEFTTSKGYSLSQNLSVTQKSDMQSFKATMNLILGNAETYMVWCDPATVKITKERCGSVYPFPLNHYVTYLKKRAAVSRLQSLWLNKELDEVYEEVDTCCRNLSNRLGNNDFFFEKPTELDAVLFGHVFTILTTTLPNNRFAATVRGYDNLINHCTRIEKAYFNFRNGKS